MLKALEFAHLPVKVSLTVVEPCTGIGASSSSKTTAGGNVSLLVRGLLLTAASAPDSSNIPAISRSRDIVILELVIRRLLIAILLCKPQFIAGRNAERMRFSAKFSRLFLGSCTIEQLNETTVKCAQG